MAASTFAELGVAEPVCAALARRGITSAFPVQAAVLPEAGSGRDLLVRAPTGSGKTLAYGLPLLEATARGPRHPRALVLAPTRELAEQIDRELGPLAAARGRRVAAVVGGMPLIKQARWAARADVVVATPGRLQDLVARNLLSISAVTHVVLDEADRMLDMGFRPPVEAILAMLAEPRQTMLFSATLDGEVADLARSLTREPVRIEADAEPAAADPLSERLEQSFLACTPSTRTDALLDLINGEEDLVMVFCRTRRGAARLADRLSDYGLTVGSLHGDLTQAARRRTLAAFASGRTRVLTATDVAARGIDLDDVGLVVNFDPPDGHDTYTHRVGRTARAGRTGRAVTLVLPEHATELARMAHRLGLQEPWAASGHAPPQAARRGPQRGHSGPSGNRPRPGGARPQAGARPRRGRPGPASRQAGER
jgi:superfamily II DNA/RNA helicase